MHWQHSEEVVFPNGTLGWFINRNYKDFGEINYERMILQGCI